MRVVDLFWEMMRERLGLRKARTQSERLENELVRTKLLLGKLLVNQQKESKELSEAEFGVFSQFGEDGIIQYLINKLNVVNKTFVEIGVENYREANTRYLLENNNWRGLIIDGSKSWIEEIKRQDLSWKYDLTAIDAFVTRKNINRLLKEAGFTGEIGLLSIDIDGNDYWIWKEIKVIDPDMVVIEYNSVLGQKRALTIPYSPKFERGKAHFSNLYFGASLPALINLGVKKGYVFVGCNSAGNNAFFVKKSYQRKVAALAKKAKYVESTFRESRDRGGRLTYLSGEERLVAIKGLPVVNVNTNKRELL